MSELMPANRILLYCLAVRLPNAEHARIDSEKVLNYLISDVHPDGKHKAEFFKAFGFSAEDWQVLREKLLKHGQEHDVCAEVQSPFGTRYTVEGDLETPDGRNPTVRTVWIHERGGTGPRLITAHPA